MCEAIVADHTCTYAELLTAEGNGELEGVKSIEGLSFWVHRIQTNTGSSQPGAGGRCNDWKEETNHLSDGEYALVNSGVINYFFDQDTTYTGDPAGGHAGNTADDGGPCDVNRALLCCN